MRRAFYFLLCFYIYIFIFILLVLCCLFYGNFSWDFPIFMQLILCLLYIPRCTIYTHTAPAISGNFLCMCALFGTPYHPPLLPAATRVLSLRCVLILICILSYSLCYFECVESVEWRGTEGTGGVAGPAVRSVTIQSVRCFSGFNK